MQNYHLGSFGDDVQQTVRTIGRICQMVLELRDEYARNHRDDALDQIERRLDELHELRNQLRERREEAGNA